VGAASLRRRAPAIALLAVAVLMLVGYPRLFHKRIQTDIYLPWRAARTVFLEHRNPYSNELTAESQKVFYGRELQVSESQLDQRRFAYPIYATYFLIPVMGLPFGEAEQLMWIVLLTATVLSVLFWLDAVKWWPGTLTFCALLAATLASPPVLQGLALRQLGLLAAFFIAAAAAAAKRRKWLLSGGLLALATIKPHEAFLAIAFFLFWTVQDWRSRKGMAIGFVATLAALVGVGELLAPGWTTRFFAALIAYRKYGGATGPEFLLGEKLGLFCSLLIFLWLIRRTWRERLCGEFMKGLALILVVQFLIVPGLFALYNAVLFLPALLLVAKVQAFSASHPGADSECRSLGGVSGR
jgi:hypothetical protein